MPANCWVRLSFANGAREAEKNCDRHTAPAAVQCQAKSLIKAACLLPGSHLTRAKARPACLPCALKLRDRRIELLRRWLITRETSYGRDARDSARMPQALASLARELLEMEATGDRARAEKWFQKYAAMPAELAAALARASDVPVDIDPIFSFLEPIR